MVRSFTIFNFGLFLNEKIEIAETAKKQWGLKCFLGTIRADDRCVLDSVSILVTARTNTSPPEQLSFHLDVLVVKTETFSVE